MANEANVAGKGMNPSSASPAATPMRSCSAMPSWMKRAGKASRKIDVRVDVSRSAGKVFALSEVSRGAAFGDVDNDGDTDVLITNNCGSPRLLVNQVGNRNHWIGLRLIDPAKRRDMIGTWVGVFRFEAPTLWRRVRTAASFCSTNDPRLLVGLGDATRVPKVTAKWPDGSVEQWTKLPVDQYTTLAKGSGTVVRDRENTE